MWTQSPQRQRDRPIWTVILLFINSQGRLSPQEYQNNDHHHRDHPKYSMAPHHTTTALSPVWGRIRRAARRALGPVQLARIDPRRPPRARVLRSSLVVGRQSPGRLFGRTNGHDSGIGWGWSDIASAYVGRPDKRSLVMSGGATSLVSGRNRGLPITRQGQNSGAAHVVRRGAGRAERLAGRLGVSGPAPTPRPLRRRLAELARTTGAQQSTVEVGPWGCPDQ